jgi:hypothetical protein
MKLWGFFYWFFHQNCARFFKGFWNNRLFFDFEFQKKTDQTFLRIWIVLQNGTGGSLEIQITKQQWSGVGTWSLGL